MRIDISFLPALAAAFCCVRAHRHHDHAAAGPRRDQRAGARAADGGAGADRVLLPLHREAYRDRSARARAGAHAAGPGNSDRRRARPDRAADDLGAAGRRPVVAQQLGLGFVTAVDPTQGQQGVIVGNFLTVLGVTLIFATDLHHLVIAALNDSYTLFAPGEIPLFGDVAALVTETVARRLQRRHPALGAVPGLRPAVQYRARRALAPDAADAGVLRRPAAVDPARLPHPADGRRHDDGHLPRIPRVVLRQLAPYS